MENNKNGIVDFSNLGTGQKWQHLRDAHPKATKTLGNVVSELKGRPAFTAKEEDIPTGRGKTGLRALSQDEVFRPLAEDIYGIRVIPNGKKATIKLV